MQPHVFAMGWPEDEASPSPPPGAGIGLPSERGPEGRVAGVWISAVGNSVVGGDIDFYKLMEIIMFRECPSESPGINCAQKINKNVKSLLKFCLKIILLCLDMWKLQPGIRSFDILLTLYKKNEPGLTAIRECIVGKWFEETKIKSRLVIHKDSHTNTSPPTVTKKKEMLEFGS